ncbi:sirohydrochlorin chelatase [Marichromatium bheemlicum]|uniref:Cobalamin biosynthesis protein CbiX n=1 Tax=Marichromatium bheemlicum TaxID=365339 RepID=A0ABX1I6V0_9GAMM|nr:CbiX/SirB N-terminal domain-containing protein [Marichromatium bheemlicum]NKN33279.1 cobalamin biosynthesis protein CbiX [Marichromatium bheemlicum]
MNKRSLLGVLGALLLLPLLLSGCGESVSEEGAQGSRVGVLLVSHGSHSKNWRDMLVDVEHSVRDRITADGRVAEVRTAFMEYTEPSISTQMRAFDEAGFDEVIVVPLFLTVSSHSLDDIPTILGMKADPKVMAKLAEEEIELYRPEARVTLTPMLDFSSLLKKNLLRRTQALAGETEDTGVVLVAYGDASYNQQWEALVGDIGRYLKLKAGIDTVAYSWCGHLVDYSPEPTLRAIEQVLELEDRAAVLPVLVAVDPDFQDEIIGTAVAQSSDHSRVLYAGDAILPDAGLNDWVVEIVRKSLDGGA